MGGGIKQRETILNIVQTKFYKFLCSEIHPFMLFLNTELAWCLFTRFLLSKLPYSAPLKGVKKKEWRKEEVLQAIMRLPL